MKKVLISFTLLLLFSIGMNGQSNSQDIIPNSYENSILDCDNSAICHCEESQIFCGSEFDGYCSVMSTSSCGTGGMIPGCTGTFNNPTWVGFVPGQSDVSFIVHNYDCNSSSGALQYGIYDDCDMENPVFLECACQPLADFQIDLTELIIGKTYYLFVDGCPGTACTISIEVLQIGDDIPDVTGPDDLLCDSDFPNCEGICVEDEVTFTMENIQNAVEYTWTINNDETIVTEVPELTHSFTESGSYHLCGYGENGCDTGDEVCIDFDVSCDCQVLNIVTEVENVKCNGSCDGSIEISDIENGNEPFTYLWSNGETTETISDLCPGDYTVTVTTLNLCTISETYTITEPAELVCNATATDETSNNGNDGTAEANPTGGTTSYVYLWSNGETTQSIINLSPGDYTVTVTDEHDCTCEQTVTVNEFICNDLYLEFSQINNNCFGECNGQIEITDVYNGTEPYYFEWSTGDDENIISNLCSGDYSVTITDYYYCSVTEDFTITEPDTLLANIVSTDVSKLGASDGIASANPTGGTIPYSYLWSTGETTQSIQNLPIGIYKLTISDINECEVIDSAIINEFICPDLTVYSTQQNIQCFNECTGKIKIDSVTSSNYPLSYIWNNGDTTDIIDNLCFGTYYLTITDNKNCEVLDTFTITQNSQLFANASATAETSKDANDGTATSNPSGGTSPYSFAWSTGQNTQSISNLAPGNYTVTVTDSDGCMSIETVSVAEYGCQGLSIVSNKTNVSCKGECNGNIEITGVTDGTAPFNYLWSTGANTAKIDSLCHGNYTVEIVDSNNCTIFGSFYILEPNKLFPNITSTNETYNNANDGSATSNPSGGIAPYHYLWSNGDSTQTISNLSPGEYQITVTDANDCSVFDTINIVEYSCPSLEVMSNITNISCTGYCDGAIKITGVTNAISPLNYTWDNGSTTASLSNLCIGEYEVTITDAKNCSISKKFNLTSLTNINITIDSTRDVRLTPTGYIAISTNNTGSFVFSWIGPNSFTSDNEDIDNLTTPGCYTLSITDTLTNCNLDSTICLADLTATIDLENISSKINLYPNPTKDNFIIDFGKLDLKNIQIKILDINGKVKNIISNIEYPKQIDIKTDNLNNGLYIIQINTKNKGILYKKIIIDK